MSDVLQTVTTVITTAVSLGVILASVRVARNAHKRKREAAQKLDDSRVEHMWFARWNRGEFYGNLGTGQATSEADGR